MQHYQGFGPWPLNQAFMELLVNRVYINGRTLHTRLCTIEETDLTAFFSFLWLNLKENVTNFQAKALKEKSVDQEKYLQLGVGAFCSISYASNSKSYHF